MAYQANRESSSPDEEKARNDANNAKNVRNAADVAIASKNPYAAAAGHAIKGADKLTGGKVSKGIGKALSKANQLFPFGRGLQNASNKLSESGLGDVAGKGASLVNQRGAGISQDKMPNQVKTNTNEGGEQGKDSLPSSGESKNQSEPQNRGDKGKDSSESVEETSETEEKKKGLFSSIFSFKGTIIIIVVSLIVLPVILIIFGIAIVSSVVPSFLSNFDDAFGASFVAGEENGDVEYTSSNSSQTSFFERVNSVKLRYQSQGKTVDAYKIAAVYHVISSYDSKFTYDDMTDSVISSIADSMFMGNMYDESTFKSNLSSYILPSHITSSSVSMDDYAEEVIQYIQDYESLIGKDQDGNSGRQCASTGSCTYSIKGYYIQGKGNVAESLEVKDLYVRLMQCGFASEHDYGGTFGKPLEGEELVPFEKYILGVAYQEIGPNSPAEAIKAQMVAARSYILARHADMGGWRTLKEENGKWVIQVASCTQDQVYCDPDKGCSSNDGQWGQIHSGLDHDSGFSREPMPSNSPLRTYASQTNGEVLVNKDGYIIYSGYEGDREGSEQDQFVSLAEGGLNYKQILLQVYNQGSRNYGASDIFRANCNGGGSSSCGGAVGDFVNWKQMGETWSNIQIGTSGRTIGNIGCLVTSIAMQIARSGVQTNVSPFDPGTFVEALNKSGGFDGGNFVWASTTNVAPKFVFQGDVDLKGKSQQDKLNIIKNLVSQPDTYVVAEVMWNTGQHWVAIDTVEGNTIKMMDPASNSTDMWSEYNWVNTSEVDYYKVIP